MPFNSLYPSFIKLFYTANGHGHVQVIPCQMSLPAGSPPSLIRKNAATQDWETCLVSEYLPLVAQLFRSSDTFSFAEIWALDTPSGDPYFVDSVTITQTGLNAAATVPYSQVSFTYRADDGGLLRMLYMEGVTAVNIVTTAPYVGTFAALHNYVVGATSWIKSRSGGYIRAGIRAVTKTNDKLRQKFLLDA